MASVVRPALTAFRRLMRAREMAFKGDAEMLAQSRLAVREEFLRNKDVPEGPVLTELLQGADEATDMLKHHVIQGIRKGEGEYAMNIDPARHVTMDPNKLPGEK